MPQETSATEHGDVVCRQIHRVCHLQHHPRPSPWLYDRQKTGLDHCDDASMTSTMEEPGTAQGKKKLTGMPRKDFSAWLTSPLAILTVAMNAN